MAIDTVTMLDFRRRAERIIARVRKGETLLLTYRGKPALRLEPLTPATVEEDDPFYAMDALADRKGKSLDNRQMDKIIYGA